MLKRFSLFLIFNPNLFMRLSIGKELFNYSGNIEFATSVDTKYLVDNPQRRCPNINKAKKDLKYKTSVGLEVGLKQFLDWAKTNYEIY